MRPRSGRFSNTGVSGLTLGGGFGWLSRRFGLACDNLISVELVTADGKVRHVSEHDEPDLFLGRTRWRRELRGRDLFRIPAPSSQPYSARGTRRPPGAQLKEAIEFYAELITRAPRELGVELSLALNEDGTPGAQIYVSTPEMPGAVRRFSSLCSGHRLSDGIRGSGIVR